MVLTNFIFISLDKYRFVRCDQMSYSVSHRRRGRHDIIGEILKIAKGGALKTRIMNKAGLSYAQLEQYLDGLKKAGFLTEKSGVWKTTEKGLHVIEACKLCHRFIKEVL